MKKFSKKITEATCIFCGAPLTSDDRCNYCGCEYITQEAIEEILYDIPNLIEFDVNKLYIHNFMDKRDLRNFRGMSFAVWNAISSYEIKFEIIPNDIKYIKDIFNSYQCYDYKLNFQKHTILAQHALMTTIKTDIMSSYSSMNITLLPDKIITS